MATLVGYGDRLITTSGRPSWLSRPSVPLAAFGGGASVDLSGGGVISYQRLYETQPWVASAVNLLNLQSLRLPLKSYRMLDGGERERIRNEPLPELLNRPWPRCAAAQLKQKIIFGLAVHGNALFWKYRRGQDTPSQLIPLDWRYVVPHYTDDIHAGPVAYWETTQTGEPRYLAPDDVVHFAFEGGNGQIGVSPLQQLGVTLRTEDAAQRYQSASFDNGVRPATGYVVPGDVQMTAEERGELRQELKAQHEGVDNAFRIALLTGGGKLETYSHTAVEAELIEQRKLNREEVAAVYHCPPPLIGIYDHATYSNIESLLRSFFGMTLGPYATLIEETLGAQLITEELGWESLFVEFDFAEVLKGETLKEIVALQTAIASGFLTLNEARQVRNMSRSDLPGMDAFYLPMNNLQPVGAPPAPAAPSSDGSQSVLKMHIQRLSDRVSQRMAHGEPGWNRDQFERELKADLDGMNGTADVYASAWADVVGSLIADADGPEEVRAVLKSLV